MLRAYRELLRLVKRLPAAQQGSAWSEARSSLRAHREEGEEAKRLELLKKLVARIGFLRTITPRRPGDGAGVGAGHYVLREGKLVEGRGATSGARWAGGGGRAVLLGRLTCWRVALSCRTRCPSCRVADGVLDMEEARTRHQQLLQRQHFGRPPPTYNPSSF